ncbi:MAG: hypothetical protein ACXWNK_03285 [Vulcanimicrobiaceae bacterium]
MTERVRFASAPARDPVALARAILADRHRFHLTAVSPRPRPKTPLQALLEWLGGLYDRLMNAMHLHVHVTSAASSLAGDLIIAALIALLLFVLVRLLREVVPETSGGPSRSALLLHAPDASALYERSREAAARKDFPHAVALLFAATVAGLDLLGVAHAEASVTVGELRRTLQSRDAALLPRFEAIARPFNEAAYAGAPIGEVDWSAAHAAFLSLFGETLHRAA